MDAIKEALFTEAQIGKSINMIKDSGSIKELISNLELALSLVKEAEKFVRMHPHYITESD